MSQIRHDWRTPTRFAWFSLGSLAIVEIGMASLADFAVIDLQHGLWDRLSAHDAVGLIGMSRALLR